ncbi:MAG: epoxyqueuosine reductase QueH [Thermotogaceae bacterium]|nr:epoxyqueuosine reductase QueH [Thermotogaceae bacterium]
MKNTFKTKNKKKLLLHVCCAPDATTAYIILKDKFNVDFYFYNPNVHPRKEYERRLDATRKLANMWKVKLTEGKYEPEKYFQVVKGYEHLGEMSYRCFLCIRQRLFNTAYFAKRLGYEYFSTSLPTSPKKDFEMVIKSGGEAEQKFGVRFYVEDFKKNEGYPLSVKLSKELNLYRQNYCGCIFSMKEAMKQRERSKKERMEKLQNILRENDISFNIEIDPNEFTVTSDLINRIGFEVLKKLIPLIRPRTLIVEKNIYERYWAGRKNAKFGKFKVKIKILERTFL